MTDKNRAASRSRIADPSLAAEGHHAIDWARSRAPLLTGFIPARIGHDLRGKRIAVVVHLEAKTALLALTLAEAGADVVVAGSNPMSTRDDVAAALVDRGIEVHGTRASDAQQWEEDLLAIADTEPEFIIDDGIELLLRVLRRRPHLATALGGVSEETTTGVARLRTLEGAGKLPVPAIAANDADCKHLFDNQHGTGQSTLQAVLGLTNLRISGKRVAVIGYGLVGRGLANYVRWLGGRVVVSEIDAIRALEAHLAGHDVASIEAALADADLVVTATGGTNAVHVGHFDDLKSGVVLANAGHSDAEIDVTHLDSLASGRTEIRPGVTRYVYHGRSINLLSHGSLVNIAGGLGHPIEIMDLSFSVQALACHALATTEFLPGVHAFPRDLDRQIAEARLAVGGIRLGQAEPHQTESLADLLGVKK
jgi:adenosylhomocysteinase